MVLRTEALERELKEARCAAAALMESEARLRQISESSAEGILIHEDGVGLMANDRLYKMFGYRPEEVVGKEVLPLLVAPECRELLCGYLAAEKSAPSELTCLRKDGTHFPVEVRGRLSKYGGRRVRVAVVRDISEHRRTIETNQVLYQISSAINTTGDLDELYGSIHNSLARIIDVRNFFIALFDRDNLAVNFPYFADEKDEKFEGIYAFSESGALTAEVITTGKPLFLREAELLERESRGGIVGTVPRVWLGVPLKFAGEVTGVMAVQSYDDPKLYDDRDVELLVSVSDQVALAIEHKRVDDLLREREQNLRIIFDSVPDAITITGLSDNAYRYVNDGFCRITGYAAKEVIGRTPFDMGLFTKLAEDSVFSELPREKLAVDSMEVKYRVKDGRMVDALLSTRLVTFGGQECIVSVVRDITAVRRTEHEMARLTLQLKHAQKMEAIGTLAGGVAHDFNNLMMAIQGNASLLRMDMEAGHPGLRKLSNIADAVERGSGLTRQLLGFAKGREQETMPTLISGVIRKNLQMFGRTRKGITLLEDYDPALWTVRVDRGQMDQVLLNLFVNASHAMDGQGTLTLSALNIVVDDRFARSHGAVAGRYVRVTVADTGVGMDAATLGRIFEPFFTTKEMERGTGLGLATAYGIIQNHKGFIRVQSAPGDGARFDLYLPAASGRVKDSQEGEGPLVRGEETILLIEDEAVIREISTEILKELGYRVIVAAGGREAISIFEKERSTIDMVILDMVMPDMGGGQVFDALRGLDDKVRILLASGYSIDSEAARIMAEGCGGFIQKPFDIRKLSSTVREILER